MSNILQLVDPLGHIIFFKKESSFEKRLTNLQGLTLYNTNLEILSIIDKGSLTKVSLIALNHLDPIVEKKRRYFTQKTDESNVLRFRTINF